FRPAHAHDHQTFVNQGRSSQSPFRDRPPIFHHHIPAPQQVPVRELPTIQDASPAEGVDPPAGDRGGSPRPITSNGADIPGGIHGGPYGFPGKEVIAHCPFFVLPLFHRNAVHPFDREPGPSRPYPSAPEELGRIR